MNLPAKALEVLEAVKAELLKPEVPPVVIETGSKIEAAEVKSEAPKKEKEEKSTQVMRHARLRGESWQRYHRTGGW